MKRKKGKRILALFLALFCFLQGPLAVQPYEMAGQTRAAQVQDKEEMEEGEETKEAVSSEAKNAAEQENGQSLTESLEVETEPLEVETEPAADRNTPQAAPAAPETEDASGFYEETEETEKESREEIQEEPLFSVPFRMEETERQLQRAVQNSVYLNCRKDSVRLNKSDAATVGDINTKIPAGYEGYIRSIAASSPAFAEESFIPDYGAWKGNSGCYCPDEEDKGRFYAWYRKSVYYQDSWIDLKMTVMDFKKVNDRAYFRFGPNRPGIASWLMEWVEVKMEFFRSDDGEAVSVKGYLTYRDIDLYQGIVFGKGFGQVYAGKDALPNIRVADVNGRPYFFDVTGTDQSAADPGFMLSAVFKGKAVSAVYTFVRPENDIGTSLNPSGGITAESYKIFSSEHPNISKTVSDSDEVLTGANTLLNKEEKFRYTLTTTIPMETEQTLYHDWTVTDSLDSFLEILQVKVTDENGADASSWWNIDTTQGFTAVCSKIRQVGFYGHTYRFDLTVGIRAQADLRTRWDAGLRAAVIRNQASAASDGQTVYSANVVTKILPAAVGLTVEKRDSRTQELLDGAEFEVQEWNGSTYVPMDGGMLLGQQEGIYTSGAILCYRASNQGRYKVVEKKAPRGYERGNWEREFTIPGFSDEPIRFTGAQACKNDPQWIRLCVNKKDSETGKAVAGAKFTVFRWSTDKNQYVLQEEFSSGADGRGQSGKLYYTQDSQGRYKVEETQASEKYVGDYKGGEPEQGRNSYEFRISSDNAGQTLPIVNTDGGADFKNVPQKARLVIRKQGDRLCGVKKQDGKVAFLYEQKPLPGAVCEIRAAEDIYRADGETLAYRQGTVVEQLVTDMAGRAVSKPLYLGKYQVVETKAPYGFVLGKNTEELVRDVELVWKGQETEVYQQEVPPFTNPRVRASVTVWKKSSDTGTGLAGAVFGLYAGEDILLDGATLAAKDTLIMQSESGSDGKCHFCADLPAGYSYYVKEIIAPENYYRQTKKDRYQFVFDCTDDRTQNYSYPSDDNKEEATFYNKEVRAEISLQKLDAESGLPKAQQGASLDGAVYGLYAKTEILAPDGSGKVLYSRDAEVQRAFTDAKGQLCFSQLPLGSYYIKEIRPSRGYLMDPERYPVECLYEGQDKEYIKRSVVSRERVMKQKIRIYKLTGDNKETDLEWLLGAGFSIYSIPELEKSTKQDLGVYTGLDDEKLIQRIIDDWRDPRTLDYRKLRGIPTATVYAKPDAKEVAAGLLVKKVTWSDGTSYMLPGECESEYKVNELYSDEQGILETCRLPYGRYLFVETTVPKGKVAAAPKILTVSTDGEDGKKDGDKLGIPMGDLAIWDQPVTSYLKITKKDAFTREPVAREGAAYVIHDIDGAYFEWYMKDKTSEEKINYKNRFGNLVVAYTNGELAGTYDNPFWTKRRKNADGKYMGTYVASTEALPQGLYILEEVSAPEGYVKQGFEGQYRTRNGKRFFEIAAGDMPSWQAIHSLKVTEKDVGAWESSEKASAEQRVKIRIGQDQTNIRYDSLAGAFITEVSQENEPAVGKLSIYAEGEMVCSWKAKEGFGYKYRPLAGNTFRICAAENIYSGEGSDTLLFAKGSIVTELTTDESGKAWTEELSVAGYEWKGLPLGLYTVEQIAAGEGFALSEENKKPRTFEIGYAGEEVPIVYQDAVYQVPRQKVELQIEKRDQASGKKLEGAKFGLYAGQDILDAVTGKILVKKDTLLETAGTKKGAEYADFTMDLPLAFYYIREESAPAGYYRTEKVVRIDARYRREGEEVIAIRDIFENQQTMLQINIMDYDTEVELDGASFSILDEKGNEYSSCVSVHGANRILYGLETGKKYTVTVNKARSGYHWNLYGKDRYHSIYEKEGYSLQGMHYEGLALTPDKIEKNFAEFTLSDQGQVQVISLFQKTVPGNLIVRKEGEVPKTKIRRGVLETISYEKEGLPGAEYDIFSDSVIMHPDGYSGVLLEAGEHIAHVVTDDQGKAEVAGLYEGNYRVKETKAPKGYVLARNAEDKTQQLLLKSSESTEMKEVICFENRRQIPDIGKDPKEPEEDSEIVNPQWKGKTGIVKSGTDGDRDVPLSGAEFTLYAKKDITDVFGHVVIPAGTEVERSVSGTDGYAVFTTDLPMGVYYARETKAPEGYYASGKEIVFDFDIYKESGEISIVRMQAAVSNLPVKARFYLTDDLTGNELAGAVFEIRDKKGKLHTAFTTQNTGGKGHLITGLVPGETYILTEKMSRSGYSPEVLLEKEGPGGLQKNTKTSAVFSIPEAETDEDGDKAPAVPVLRIRNAFRTGDVEISKTGQLLNTAERTANPVSGMAGLVKTWFGYLTGGVEKAEFSIVAGSDIYHPDGVTGLLYQKGEVVDQFVRHTDSKTKAHAVTDASGKAFFRELYLGQYLLEETNIPEGYRKHTKPISFTLADSGGDTDTVKPAEGILTVYNERQQVEIFVTKRDREHPEKVLPGAVFGLYTKEKMCAASGQCLLPAGTLLETQKTDRNGVVCFSSELPLGKYDIAELEAPYGYYGSTEILHIDASWKEQGMEKQTFRLDFLDQITKTNICKRAQDTGRLLPGARLALYQNGRCIESWDTGDKVHCVEGLKVGEKYVLKERKPAPGYVTAEDKTFIVEDRTENENHIQEVTMTDAVTEIHISVYEKNGKKKNPLSKVKAHLEKSDGSLILAEGKECRWISSGKPEIRRKVPVGKHYAVVDRVPKGYVFPARMAVKVRDTSRIQKYEIEIAPIRIHFFAADADTQKELQEVTITVLDSKGRKVWDNLKLPELKEKAESGNYTIKVEEVPKGYQKPQDMQITVKEIADLQKFKLELPKETSDGEGEDKILDTPKQEAARTEDTMSVIQWLVLLVFSGAAVMSWILQKMFYWKKKE